MNYATALEIVRTANWLEPKVDQKAAAAALHDVFEASGLAQRRMEWITAPQNGPGQLYFETHVLASGGLTELIPNTHDGVEASRITRRNAVRTALRWAPAPWSTDALSISLVASNALVAIKADPKSKRAKIGAAYLKMLEAGAFAILLTRRIAYVLQRPLLHTRNGALDNAHGPALVWPDSKPVYFWRGTEVPENFIMAPQDVDFANEIRERANGRQTIAMLSCWLNKTDRIDQYYKKSDQNDSLRASLYRIDTGRYRIGALRVVNPTKNAEGKRDVVYLMVPHSVRTCKDAVAFTYGLSGDQYEGVHRT